MSELFREEKLPQWVQERLALLRQQVAGLQQQVSILKTEGTGTGLINVVMDSYQTPLPDRAVVSFNNGQDRIEFFLDADLVVRVYARGKLEVMPQASNSIYLKSK